MSTHKEFKLFSYLNQICEGVAYFVEMYKYSSVIVVLSVMYLLVRIDM
jgi:hypothetical protein